MRILLIGSTWHPIREPFAGGLEAATHVLAASLAARGHDVSLFAGGSPDLDLPVRHLPAASFVPSAAAMRDRNAPSLASVVEHHAYLELMLALSGRLSDAFDVVHNNSLHHLPVAMAPAVPVPVVTTLHTPPLPLLESAITLAPSQSRFAAVSAHTAAAWAHVVGAGVVRNGLDLSRWTAGPGGPTAVWTGRLVPEKAPHEAIAASRRAGVPLVLAGPTPDASYFDAAIAPELGPDVTYAGHLRQAELAELVGAAGVAVVTPDWDEPYGLVAAEAMAVGTPVAGYARGGLPEFVEDRAGVLVPPGDVESLALAISTASRLDRAQVRAAALRSCDAERMTAQYEELYVSTLDTRSAA